MDQYNSLVSKIREAVPELKDVPREMMFVCKSYVPPEKVDANSWQDNFIMGTTTRLFHLEGLYEKLGESVINTLGMDYKHERYPFDLGK